MTTHPPDNGVAPKVVGRVEVVMLDTGVVVATCDAPSRNVMVMMLEAAKLDLDAKFREQTKQNQNLLMPPPGLRVPRQE